MTDVVSGPGRRARSPGYPAVGLEEALRRARLLYERERRHPAPVKTILEHWGYKPNSGTGMVVVAALKKFGLLEDEGSGSSRKARLTELAIKIILDDREDSSERRALIKEAALKPAIHTQLWEEFRGFLPSDSNLRFKLLTERHFNERGVREFLPQLRETLAFAGLSPGDADSLPARDGDKDRTGDQPTTFTSAPLLSPGPSPPKLQVQPAVSTTAREDARETRERVFYLPLGGGALAALQVPYPMTKQQWKQLMAILAAMESGIVNADEPSSSQPTD